MSEKTSAKKQFIELLEKVIPEQGIRDVGGSISFTMRSDLVDPKELKLVDDAIRGALTDERIASVHRVSIPFTGFEKITVEVGYFHEAP